MIDNGILTAVALLVDRSVGDPPRIPHPVVLIGSYIRFLDSKLNAGNNRLHPTLLRVYGMWLTLSTVLLASGATFCIDDAAYRVSPFLAIAVQVWLISTTIAWNGLLKAGCDVYSAITQDGLPAARQAVGHIVGRDTDHLTEAEVSRAAVETLAENLVDGVVSPVFYACIGGAPLAMAYRAINTLDSMVGYRNERYRHFGFASARTDDVANYLPARFTALLLYVLFAMARMHPARSWRMMRRDAKKHPSPNGGIPESMVAGALGVQLGGLNYYGGIASHRAVMGDATRSLVAQDVRLTTNIVERFGWLLWLCVTIVSVSVWIVLR